MVAIALELISRNRQERAPRLNASIPMLPVPPNKSKNVDSIISVDMMLKSASLTLSVTGRVESPGTGSNRIPRAFPAMILGCPILIPEFYSLAGGSNIGVRSSDRQHTTGAQDKSAACSAGNRALGFFDDQFRGSIHKRFPLP